MLIKNGLVCLKEGFTNTDLLISNGKIEAIGRNLRENGQTIDAAGKAILPGCIDIHVHAREPGNEEKEDWLTISKAALNGGVTTIMDMPNNKEPIISVERLLKKKVAAQKSLVNRGFYAGITGENIDEAAGLARLANGFKIYISETTNAQGIDWESLEYIFKALAPLGRPVVVHAEDNALFSGDDTSLAQHSSRRSQKAELSAVKKVIEFAKIYKTKLHITHVSTCEAATYILGLKNEHITFDVTPHHLYFNIDNAAGKGAFAKVNPPLRMAQDNDCLRRLLANGKIDIVASDHAPHCMHEKNVEFRLAPAGISNIDTFLQSLLNLHHTDGIEVEKIARCAATNPAELFGMAGRGVVEEGAWADLAIVEIGKSQRVTRFGLFTKCGWNIFEGMELKGAVVGTMVNGNLSYWDDTFGEATGMEIPPS